MWIHVCGSATTSFFSRGRGTCICLEAVSPVQGYLNLTGSGPHAALRLELAEERGGEGTGSSARRASCSQTETLACGLLLSPDIYPERVGQRERGNAFLVKVAPSTVPSSVISSLRYSVIP